MKHIKRLFEAKRPVPSKPTTHQEQDIILRNMLSPWTDEDTCRILEIPKNLTSESKMWSDTGSAWGFREMVSKGGYYVEFYPPKLGKYKRKDSARDLGQYLDGHLEHIKFITPIKQRLLQLEDFGFKIFNINTSKFGEPMSEDGRIPRLYMYIIPPIETTFDENWNTYLNWWGVKKKGLKEI